MSEGSFYPGKELGLFSEARNWKKYFGFWLAPYIKGSVLEVGAGIGSTTHLLCTGKETEWLCLEPDHDLAAALRRKIKSSQLPAICRIKTGTIADLTSRRRFQTILYIDVLEHVSDDREEMRRAERLLCPGGFLIVLAPAHHWLMSQFDKAIGHQRRYTFRSLQAVVPASLSPIKILYLDSAGLVASLGNKLLINKVPPTLGPILFWDRVLVPISRVLDKLLRRRLGKSVLGIWKKESRPS